MTTPVLVGIDVSTTGVKVLALDAGGRVLATETTPLALSTPRPLWSEQNPDDWWRGAVHGLRRLLRRPGLEADDVAAIGLTGQMHGLVLLDDERRVLRPAILWNDQRTAEECALIRATVGRQRLIATTGNDALTGFTAPKLLWVRRHEPEVYRRVRAVLLPKDYVRSRLTNALAIDKADGSGTLLFDLARRDWSHDIVAALEIPDDWLPPAFEGPEVTGLVSDTAARGTGLKAGTPVVAGGGDQSAGAVGVGAVDPGSVSVVLGTSGVVFAATSGPVIEPEGRLHAFCHALPGRWHVMGVMLSAAGSLQWYRDVCAPEVSFDVLLEEAARAPAGADGLVFLPYLMGERTPHADPVARGAFVGLTRRHTRAHLTRAVLEGVACGLRESFDLVAGASPTVRAVPPPHDTTTPPTTVRISGGGAKSALWRRIIASLLDTRVELVAGSEAAALGAALLAGTGAGVWPDVAAACRAAVAPTGVDEPDAAWQSRYATTLETYRSLYPALRASFNRPACDEAER